VKRLMMLIAISMFSTTVTAGQPWIASSTGTPYHWNAGIVKWTYTNNDLTESVTNHQAMQMVEDAFATWTNAGILKAGIGKVKTATLQPVKVGQLSDKVTKDNYITTFFCDDVDLYFTTGDSSYCGAALKIPSVVVFDKDGSIVADWCATRGACDPTSIMAYTMPLILDPYSPQILHSMVILNGPMLTKQGQAEFNASVVHEIGHLFGLDHSGLNDGFATIHEEGANPKFKEGMGTSIPTMYPICNAEESTLHMDDVVAISSIYPNDNFSKEFCMITGKIVDSEGKGIQGLEVEAHSTDNDFGTNAVSTMTGADFPVPTQTGHYYLRGIIPGKTYTVQFSSLPQFLSAGSGIGMFDPENGVASPLLNMPPIKDAPAGICDPNIPNCIATTSGGSVKVVSCDKGGQTIVMDPTTVNNAIISPLYTNAPVAKVKEYAAAAAPSSGKTGGCTLIR